MTDPQALIKYWLEEIVIGLNLCPFAKLPYEKDLLKTRSFEQFDMSELESLISKLEPKEYLENHLWYFPRLIINFPEFYSLKEDLQENLNLINTPWDIIAFHPRFQFETEPFHTRVNFVNRSPFPALHLIQKSDLEKIPKEDGMAINHKNEETLTKLSDNEIRKYFYYL